MEIMDKISGAGAAVTSETVQTLCYLTSLQNPAAAVFFFLQVDVISYSFGPLCEKQSDAQWLSV